MDDAHSVKEISLPLKNESFVYDSNHNPAT